MWFEPIFSIGSLAVLKNQSVAAEFFAPLFCGKAAKCVRTIFRILHILEKRKLSPLSPPAAGKLAIDFKKPWNYLAELPAEARGEAPSEAKSGVNKLWWCLLDEIRTFFEQNPEDFAD